jgi:cytochrome c-type biogenesis protein CcmH
VSELGGSVRDVALTRRRFFHALGASAVTSAAVAAGMLDPRAAWAQEQSQSAASNVPMDPSGYREVRVVAKPGAKPQLTALERDALERTLKCQCPCTLDVFTCRTTDFSCGISPAMHKDVMALVAGGYSADEIIGAFKQTYGERVLMAPVKEGFNWAGYVAPFIALGTGAAVLTALIRKWGHRAAQAATVAAPNIGPVNATPDELARLEAALRDDA